ncbi:MAG: 30S ribosomal protein S4 [Minisyncoccia bacterium]|jgi:small subunit ribosomal protein S4
MITGPKYKICKRLGASVFEKCQTQKYQLAEARAPHRTGRPKRGGGTDFSAQLLEKQKARFTYGLSERQFSRYVHEAMERKGKVSTEMLMNRLEARLDNVIFRAGFGKTRRAARQLVSHAHVTINGTRMSIPSHAVKVGDIVSIREGSKMSPLFANRAETVAETKTPAWLSMSADGFSATIIAAPTVLETEAPFNPATIIQFYSR